MAKQIERILLQGHESEEGVNIIISLTAMTSEQMKKALIYHLVSGAAEKYCCMAFGISQSNFTRDLKKLNDVARKIDRYFELNYKRSQTIEK